MATISASLKLFDQFSQNLARANQAMQNIMGTAERLKQVLQSRISLDIDMNAAIAHVEQMKRRIQNMAGSSAIHILIDADDVLRRIRYIRQRIHSEISSSVIRIDIDQARITQQVQAIRNQLQAQLGTINTQIQLQLPAALTGMFQNLQRLVLQLLRAVRRVRVESGGAQQLQQALTRIAELERQVVDLQERLNRRIREGGSASGALLGNIKAIAAAYLSIQGAQALFSATIGGAMEQQKMQDMFKARTGDDLVGTAMFEKFKKEALAAGMDVNESLKGTLSFFSTTQDADQLTKLNNLAQRLNAFDAAGNGMEGAAFALKEAMSGDIVSLAERFNMSKTDIRAFKIDDLGKAGDMEGFIKAFDKLLEKQKMGQKAFETMLASPAKQAEILKNNMNSAFADAGQGGMKALLPLILTLNQAFQAGRFQPFFDGLYVAMRIAAISLSSLVNGGLWLFDVFTRYWPEISMMLLALGMVYVPTLTASLWAMVKPITVIAAEWMLAHWPILLVVAAVGILIYTLREFGVTTDQIVGFVAGAFAALFASIHNKIALVWNVILAFAEFFVNIFINPVYAVKKLFYDLATTFMGYTYNMIRSSEDFAGEFTKAILRAVNKALESFNWLVDSVNDMFGTNITKAELFDANNVHAVSDKINEMMSRLEKPVSAKNVVDFTAYRMDQKNLKDAFDSGYTSGADLFNKVAQGLNGYNLNDWNKGFGNIDKVGEVGKINDKVDISSEDLKLMRELAEMKNIQNFVSLTPTVNVQTGDINNGYDIDTVVSRIEKNLEEEFAKSARGVYS